MMVYEELHPNDKLTEEQLKMLRELEVSPAVPDEDSPELTDGQMAKLAEAARERRQRLQNKQTVTIRLSPQALEKAKSLGKGYTSVLSRILENALNDNEVIKQNL
ncbi:MAG: BrnA antitoxin family protein [Clostridium sp.]|nr:BrnA antitoxin family protein [Clostridium sp.]MCM1209179.1 BrnA antitoxin family protein [Ruminococcus sp.]